MAWEALRTEAVRRLVPPADRLTAGPIRRPHDLLERRSLPELLPFGWRSDKEIRSLDVHPFEPHTHDEPQTHDEVQNEPLERGADHDVDGDEGVKPAQS